MDEGIVKSFGQMYPCVDALHIYGQTIHDTHPYGRMCSVAEIMKESSNIGTAEIADQLGAERQKKYLKKMGFLERVKVELPERGRTLTPGSNWGPFETLTVGFGHGIAVTPLHLAIASAARPAPPKKSSAATIARPRWSPASPACSRWTSRATSW
jgi:cell division protein FtsI (penicillin-binding protein 3)